MSDAVFEKIQKDLKNHPVMLYMKGIPEMPQCGFSSVVCQILQRLGVHFEAQDVLKDPELRQGIKDFSRWPTIPQLYVQGEFIGGCDIVKEMYQTGELKTLLEEQGIL